MPVCRETSTQGNQDSASSDAAFFSTFDASIPFIPGHHGPGNHPDDQSPKGIGQQNAHEGENIGGGSLQLSGQDGREHRADQDGEDAVDQSGERQCHDRPGEAGPDRNRKPHEGNEQGDGDAGEGLADGPGQADHAHNRPYQRQGGQARDEKPFPF